MSCREEVESLSGNVYIVGNLYTDKIEREGSAL